MKGQSNEAHRSEDIRGNFAMGTWFGEVRCIRGHPVRLFNIGRGHWVACDKCRMYMFVGSNLMSSWRSETDSFWRANDESVWGYRCIE